MRWDHAPRSAVSEAVHSRDWRIRCSIVSSTGSKNAHQERTNMQVGGFIGLRIMGTSMAANLQKAGYKLVRARHTPGLRCRIWTAGAKWADGPMSLAAQSQVIFTSLPRLPMWRSPRWRRRSPILLELGNDEFRNYNRPTRPASRPGRAQSRL